MKNLAGKRAKIIERKPNRQKEYAEKNKNRISKNKELYYIKNKEIILKRCKEYQLANPDKRKKWKERYKLIAKQKKHNNYTQNRNKILNDSKLYHKKHREQRMEYTRKWRIENKKYVKMYEKTRRTKRMQQKKEIMDRVGILSIVTVQKVYEDNIKKYGQLTCVLCYKHILFGEDSLEHLTPLSRGGTNDYKNLAIAHLRCNCSKKNKTLEEWCKYNA